MNGNRKKKMYADIRRHGDVLNQIFNTGLDSLVLCKKLKRIEGEAARLALGYCNGDISTEEWEKQEPKILAKVEKVLRFTAKGVPVFINSDPRGYALKIRSEWVAGYNNKADNRIHTDWGGYGILAPDFSV